MRKFNVTVNGKSYEVEVEEISASGAQASYVAAPIAAPAQAVEAAPVRKPAAVSGGKQIVAPMPGIVLKFLVPAGSAVKALQPVIVLEAMKMEQEIVSPCDGKISYTVSAGSTVESKAVLAVVS